MQAWTEDFKFSLDLVDFYFGKKAFKIIRPDFSTAGNFNSAIYDAQMIGLAETTSHAIRSRVAPINVVQGAFIDLTAEKTFSLSVQRATSDEAAVETRISRAVAVFNGI